jgi:hypothetical protein
MYFDNEVDSDPENKHKVNVVIHYNCLECDVEIVDKKCAPQNVARNAKW